MTDTIPISLSGESFAMIKKLEQLGLEKLAIDNRMSWGTFQIVTSIKVEPASGEPGYILADVPVIETVVRGWHSGEKMAGLLRDSVGGEGRAYRIYTFGSSGFSSAVELAPRFV